MTWTTTGNPQAGLPPLTDHATPDTVETVGATALTNPLVPLGTIAKFKDPTYGEGEFIRLVGVASTIVGSVVTYDATTWQTALAVNTAVQARPVAVAMSVCVGTEHGWYQINGLAIIKKTAVAMSPQITIFLSATAGRVKALASAGLQIAGCRTANLATISAAVSTIIAHINRPHLQTQIT